MADDEPEVEYFPDEGYARLNLRRPVNLYLPTEAQDGYDPMGEGEEPQSTLELEWIYGYRGRDCRNNVFLLSSGEIVYFAASAAVVYNPDKGTQRHFVEHTDDIKCIAVHPEGKLVATGQIKGQGDRLPHVRVWDSETLETVSEFGSDTFGRGVSSLSFSGDGSLMCITDDSQEPILSLWNWADGEMMAKYKASGDPIIGTFYSKESEPRMVTCGKNHLAFWTQDGERLERRSGIFGKVDKPKFVTSISAMASGDVVTGDTNGNILVWEQGGQTISRIIEGAHSAAVFYIEAQQDGGFISCGKDRAVKSYDENLEPTGDVIEIPEEFGLPRVAIKVGDNLFVGTTYNALLKTAFGAEDPPEVITQGHREELWGLGASPNCSHFMSGGQDGMLYFRDASTHQIQWKRDMEVGLQSVAMSPENQIAAVGSTTGKWFIIDLESKENLFEAEDGEEAIQVISFSPCGDKVALGSRDNKAYVYSIADSGKEVAKLGECEGHSSFITHLDWSEDGEMLRTNSGDYEVLFWNVSDFSQETDADAYKDRKFATCNCILAFESLGVWPPNTDGTHLNGANKAKDKPLIATGDDLGMVKLFKFPATTHNAPHSAKHGHSSHVTTVIFCNEDSLLLSAGGRDTAILQWKVADKE